MVDSPHQEGTKCQNPRSALILGMGRSGTNFLLRLFDASPFTHSRNEPDRIPGSSCWPLFEVKETPTPGPDLAATFEACARQAAGRSSWLDPTPPRQKNWYGLPGSVWLLKTAIRGQRVVDRRLGWKIRKEFRLRSPWVRPAHLAQCLHLLKINAAPALAEGLAGLPHLPILHIVRHPAGFLRSWKGRWLAKNKPDQVHSSNQIRLNRLTEADPHWAKILANADFDNVEETELWYWRHCTERIHAAAKNRPGYELVRYEALAENPIATMQGIFEILKLPWDAQAETSIRAQGTGSVGIASRWQEDFDAEQAALLDKVLDGSPLRDWWQTWPSPQA